jgi:hypothetical protein
LKAAWPASRRALAAAMSSGWMKLRSLKGSARRPAAAPGSVPGRAQPKQASWLHALTGNPRRSRHVVWASLGVAAIAFGFGTYLLSRPGPTPQLATEIPKPVPQPLVVTAPPEPIVTAPVTSAEPSAEVLAILQRVVDERKVMEKARVLVTQAVNRAVKEAALAKAKRDKELRDAKAEEQRLANERDIKNLLDQVENDYVEGRIYVPAGNSAADRYLAILKLNAGHTEAQAKLDRIGQVVAAETNRYLKVGDTTQGSTLLSRLRGLQPQHPKLASLETLLQEVQAKPVVLARREKDTLARNSRLIDKSNKVLDKKAMTFRDMDSASDAYADAEKASVETPGLETLRERIVVTFPASVKAQWDNNAAKDAKRTLDMARKRNLSSEELEKLDSSINQGQR